MTVEEIFEANGFKIQQPSDYVISTSPVIKSAQDIALGANSELMKLSASSLGTAGRLAFEAVNIPSILDKPWLITSEPAIEKPTVEEELSKIHEELANQNQDNNELRKERKADKKENKEQQLVII